MSTQVKRRRGTAAENASFTGAAGEFTFLTDTKRMAAHDGSTAGGFTIPNGLDLLSGALTRGTASGTDTYTLTLPYFPSYVSGYEIDVTFTNANTTTSTLNVNGLGAKGLKDETGTNFTSGQIAAGSRYTFRYNGTEFRRVSSAAGTVKSVKPQIFSASGTYTPSTGMLYCLVQLVGGGGGGGGCTNGGNFTGAGGGAGGYSQELMTAATVGASQTVTIGAAGSAGNTSGSDGGAGGTTSFGALLQATGGAGGVGGSTIGSKAGGAGGVGSNGDVNTAGQGGSAGQGNATNNYSFSGAGGNSYFGGGGDGKATNATGTDGSAGGGGGGGHSGNGTTSRAGGAGGAGYMVITEWCSQ